MIKNYFKVAYRSLVRNKTFSFINVVGLAVGLATCMLIMLYIADELGYDRHHVGAERIYRIATIADQLGFVQSKPWAATSAPIAWGLKSDFPELEQVTRLLKFPTIDKILLKHNDGKDIRQFYETNGYYVDSTFFQVFTYDFRYGNTLTAMDAPNSVVLSDEVALKLFGDTDPIGQLVSIGIPYGDFDYTVKGVFKSGTVKSHIPAHFFLSMRNGDIGSWVEEQTNWATNNIFHTYVKLRAGTDAKAVEQKLQPFMERRAGTDLKALGISKKLFMQPVPDIYLHSDLDNEIAANGNATYLHILGSIALFVLLVACINFMNLSTARSGKRAKEVGIRKVVGAEKRLLVMQFLGESVMMSCLGLLLAFCLAWMCLPWFNYLTQRSLNLSDTSAMLWGWMAVLTICTGVISGFYPAFYLSSFMPVTVLKGKLLNNFSAVTLRKGLVVFQFVISICLVLGAIVINRQLHYMSNQHLGFNKSQQLILPLQSQDARNNYVALKDELSQIPGIEVVTSGSTYPGIANVEDMLFYPEGKTINDLVDVHLANVNHDYFETLGLTLLEGRGFSKEFTADSNSIVLNEAAINELGYDIKTAVGKNIHFDFRGMSGSFQIIGVVKNFNFESLHNTIKPFGFNTYFGDRYSYAIANVSTTDYASLLKAIERAWKRLNPGTPFMYSFLDKDFQQNHEKDLRASGVVSAFAMIAILVACMGLFGLSAFSAEQRIREIGIRKVLGASVSGIVRLLSNDFIKLVLIATVIASPIAWWMMNTWLENFAYRIDIEWWMFGSAGLVAVVIALLTVSWQAIRAAVANPVDSLRDE